MKEPKTIEFRRAGKRPRAARPLWLDRWYGRVAMMLASIALLTFAYAPYHQFYLAWVGLVPFLLMVRRTRSAWTALLWGWLGGTAFFIANMWWLAYVTVPGMFALLGYLGLSWGVFSMIVRGATLLEVEQSQIANRKSQIMSILLIATVWSGCEWFRGNYPFDGLPWLYLGHTQTPFLAMCQIGDVLGATGVTFWVALVNALVAILLSPSPGTPGEGRGEGSSSVAAPGQSDGTLTLTPSRRTGRGDKRVAIALVALVLIGVGAYGVFRMNQQTLTAGPSVMVVQANFPQSNETGRKGATLQEIVDFHVTTTRQALQKLRNEASEVRRKDEGGRMSEIRMKDEGGRMNERLPSSFILHPSSLPDLVVWSETMMPDINPRARQILQGVSSAGQEDYGAFSQKTHEQLQNIAMEHKVALLAGGSYFDAWIDRQTDSEVRDNRNSAYYFDRTGLPAGRYDKIHLVPWGEFIPFRHTIPWLYRLFLSLSPYTEDYTLNPGRLEDMTVFELSDDDAPVAWRFIVPICFEDIDAGLVAKMLRPLEAGGNKRANFIVNITNDGWFKANQQLQHLQVAVFRSIENRVPTARSVNTGISGFIDPLGRIDKANLIAQNDEGWRVATLALDSRTSPFTRYGEWFGALCAIATAAIATVASVRWGVRRRERKPR